MAARRPIRHQPARRRKMYTTNRCGSALALTLILLLFTTPAATGQEQITVSATLSSSALSIHEAAKLTITVNGTRSAEVELPETEGFELIQRGSSRQFNLINGQYSSSITFTCLLRAMRPGSFEIPAITISAEDQVLTTEPIPFTVSGSGSASGSGAAPSKRSANPAGADTGRPAFLEINLPKDTAYIGEIFPIEIRAYFQHTIRASLTSLPELTGDGMVMAQLTDKPNQTQEAVDGVMHNVLTWKTNISTIKVGRHPFHMELQAVEHVPQKRMNTSLFGRQSPFDDDFFDSMLGGYTQRPIKLASKQRSLEVLPLPEEGRPDQFSGAIGEFYVHAHAEPTVVEPGEPITLSISIRGQGNFDRVDPPVFPEHVRSAWRTYSPVATFHPADVSGLAGEKIFEQAVVARNGNIVQIPALSFSYFDPKQGAYVSTETKPIPVQIVSAPAAPTTVQPTPVQPQPVSPANTATTAPPQGQAAEATIEPSAAAVTGLAPLHLETGKVVGVIQPIYRTLLFQLYLLICLIVIVAAAVLKIRQIQARGTPEEQRRRKRTRMLNNGIAALKKAESAGDSSAYLNQCRTLIQQHLGYLWQCEPGAITSAGATSRLPAGSRLAAVLARAEHAVYSGALMSAEEMAETTQTVKMELEKLL